MPGPSNGKRKRKSKGKKTATTSSQSSTQDAHDNSSDSSSSHLESPVQIPPILNTSPYQDEHIHPVCFYAEEKLHDFYEPALACPPEHEYTENYSHTLPQKPCIHNPGNGPRVTNMNEFLASRFFAQPPALDDPLCAEFAQGAVLEMIKTILPEELALILWYNKSRAKSRVCPSCQRLYYIGDILPDLELDVSSEKPLQPPPQLEREQELSGICSSMCFILASFNQCDPRTTKAAWGHTADEMDDASWAILNGASSLLVNNQDVATRTNALVTLVRITRLDLAEGLAQLCFPDINWKEEVGI